MKSSVNESAMIMEMRSPGRAFLFSKADSANNFVWLWLILLVSISLPLMAKGRGGNRVRLKQVFSVRGDDVLKLYPYGAQLESFDISPDGNIFAAEFEARQADGKAAIRVGEWNISTGKLILQRPIEGPAPMDRLYSSIPNPAQYRPDLRFAPGGSKLVALTGPEIKVLDARSLKVLYSVSPPAIYPAPSEGVVIRQFLISKTGGFLVVVSSRGAWPWGELEVGTFSLGTSERTAGWSLPPVDGAYFSLSPDGSELLESQGIWGGHPGSVVIWDTRTGKQIGEFSCGVPAGACASGNRPQFLDNGDIVAPVVTTSSKWNPGALVIINVRTSKVVKILAHEKHDIGVNFVTAARAPVISALIFSWKWGIGKDMDNPFTRYAYRLALYNADRAGPLYVRRKIRLYGRSSFFVSVNALWGTMLRISRDGNTLALMEYNSINVYHVEPTAGVSSGHR